MKLHLLLDHEGYLPVFAHITDGRVHEVNIARGLSFPRGSIVVIDRGYVDYKLFGKRTGEGVYFVCRNIVQCPYDTDLDSTRSDIDTKVSEASFYLSRTSGWT